MTSRIYDVKVTSTNGSSSSSSIDGIRALTVSTTAPVSPTVTVKRRMTQLPSIQSHSGAGGTLLLSFSIVLLTTTADR